MVIEPREAKKVGIEEDQKISFNYKIFVTINANDVQRQCTTLIEIFGLTRILLFKSCHQFKTSLKRT